MQGNKQFQRWHRTPQSTEFEVSMRNKSSGGASEFVYAKCLSKSKPEAQVEDKISA